MPNNFDKMSVEELQAFIQEEEKRKAQEEVFAQLPQQLIGTRLPQGLTGPDTGSRTPFMDPANLGNLKDRALGGISGAAVGGPVGAALGIAMPPKNKSDWAALMAGGVVSKAAPAVNKIPGLLGTLAAGGAGVAENVAMNGARNLTGDNVGVGGAVDNGLAFLLPAGATAALRNPALTSKAKQITNSAAAKADEAAQFMKTQLSRVFGRDVSLDELNKLRSPALRESAQPGFGLASSPAGRAFAASTNAAAKRQNAHALAKTEAEEALAKMKAGITDKKIDQISAQADVRAAKNDNRAEETRLRSVLDKLKREEKINVTKAKLDFDAREDEMLRPGIEEAANQWAKAMDEGADAYDGGAVARKLAEGLDAGIASRAETYAARQQLNAQKLGQTAEGPLEVQTVKPEIDNLSQQLPETKASNIETVSRLEQEVQQKRVELLKAQRDAQLFKDLDLKRINENLKQNPAVEAGVSAFMKGVHCAEAFTDKLVKADGDQVRAVRALIPKAGQKAFEETFQRTWANMALGPAGDFSGMDQAAKAFPFEKIVNIYGGDMAAKVKAGTFMDVIGQAKARQEAQKLAAAEARANGQPWADKFKNKLGWITASGGSYFAYKLASSNLPVETLAKGAAISAGTALVVNWPKMVDHAVNNPKFGAQLSRLMQDTTEGALKNYPLIQKYLVENNVKDKEKTPE